MEINVIKNGKKNLLTGVVNRMIVLLCPFIERTILVRTIGADYLGLGSLFSSILTVLSVTELGFSSAIVYNMYKPAAEGDTNKINALLAYYKKAYRIIGFIIFGVGIAVIPFLKSLILGSYPEGINLPLLYLIFLCNTCISYFMYSYLGSILTVYQREDVNSTINSVLSLFFLGCQIAILVLTKNYYYFALLMPLFTITGNLWMAWRVHKLYPQYHAQGTLSQKEKADIKKLVAGTFVHRAFSVTRNSLDSICISAFLGLTLTAIYNNYFAVFTGVISFVGLINAAFMGGIGNHVATRSVKENYDEMKKLDFVYLWLGGWCTICLLCLYQPFMELWMGEDLMLPFSAVFLICLYFYLLRLGDIRSMYASANGQWWEQRHRAIGETILNLVLNITLGRFFGVHGIIIATIISLLLCDYLWSVGITFKLYFSSDRKKDYYTYQGKQTLVNLLVCMVTYGLCDMIRMDSLPVMFLIRAIICLIVPNALFYTIYRKSDRFVYAKKKIFGTCNE